MPALARRDTITGIWPGDTRCVAMLTFDIDGVTEFVSQDPQLAQHPSLMSMAEFGPRVGATRVLELLDNYNVKTTFCIPGYVAECYPDLVRDIARRGHEVAHHGYLHERLTSLSPEAQVEALDKGITALEGITGERPLGYRAPGVDPSHYTLDLLSQRGFLYDSSLMGDDAPYFVETQNGRLVELPVHWFLDEPPHYAYAPVTGRMGPMASVEQVYRNWVTEFEGAYQYGRGFILMLDPGHAGHLSRILILERLIQHIRSFPGVEFMRCVDVARQWKEQQG